MNTAWLDIVFLIIAAAVGYGVGLLDKRVTSAMKQKKQEKEEVLAAQKEAERLARAEAEVEKLRKALEERDQVIAGLKANMQAEVNNPRAENGQTALRVQVGPSGEWGIEMDGQPVPLETLTTEQRQRLVGIIVQIRPWIDGKKISPPAEPGAAQSASPTPVPPPAARPATLVSDTSPQAAPRINPLRGIRSMIANEVKKEAPPSLSIISMIDEILQQKLQASPLASKSIRMEEGQMGEVVVHVGAVRYSGIDSVPDPTLRSLIQDAIEEFNRTR